MPGFISRRFWRRCFHLPFIAYISVGRDRYRWPTDAFDRSDRREMRFWHAELVDITVKDRIIVQEDDLETLGHFACARGRPELSGRHLPARGSPSQQPRSKESRVKDDGACRRDYSDHYP